MPPAGAGGWPQSIAGFLVVGCAERWSEEGVDGIAGWTGWINSTQEVGPVATSWRRG